MNVTPLPDPVVTVVVPTYRRADRLPRLFAGLDAQDLAAPFEVVVVDDCSPDDTSDVLRSLVSSASFPARVIRPAVNGGAAVARNLGWRAARAPLVCFTDDDCRPAPSWLRGMVAALGCAAVVQGCTLPDPLQIQRRGAFSHTMYVPEGSPFYETCNMGYRRAMLEQLGGFDETLTISGEDTDLAHRAIAVGATVTFVPDAVVWHEVCPSSYRASFRKMRTYDGLVRVVLTHRVLERYFDGRVIWFRRQRLALVATAGLALASRPRARLAARAASLGLALPYAFHRLRREPLPVSKAERIARLPQVLVYDLAECAHVSRNLWRYRALR